MQTRIYLAITGVLFGLITILQAARLINHWPVAIGTLNIPLWVSGIAVIVAAGLCLWAFCLINKAGRGE